MPLGCSRSEGISVPKKRAFVLLVMQCWPYFRRRHLRLHQQSISCSAECSGNKFPTFLGALLFRAAFLQLALKWYPMSTCFSSKAMQPCSLISYANPWMSYSVQSAPASGTWMRMPSQTFIASYSGTWQKFSKAPCELHYHSQKSMLFVALLTPVMRRLDFCDQLVAKPHV